MSKVIELRTKNKNVLEFVDGMKQHIKDENVDNLLILYKYPDGSIGIGYTKNIDIGTMLELNAHIQMHAVDKMIQKNYLE